MGTGCWRKERTECDGVMKQGAGERRGEGVTVFGNRVLERRGQSVMVFGNRVLERGEDRV